MPIIFTDKLSKIVAQYENLRDMIFDLNTSFAISWDPGEESIQYHGQDLSLNDISSQNEVRASRYLTLKNNKISEEEDRQEKKTSKNLFWCLRERLVDKNGWQHYVYQVDECALHGFYIRATGIELYRNDFATTTQLQVACITWKPTLHSIAASYHLSHMLQ